MKCSLSALINELAKVIKQADTLECLEECDSLDLIGHLSTEGSDEDLPRDLTMDHMNVVMRAMAVLIDSHWDVDAISIAERKQVTSMVDLNNVVTNDQVVILYRGADKLYTIKIAQQGVHAQGR